MTDAAPLAPPPIAQWRDLRAELDRWAEAGRVAPLWRRDDDAVTATPELAEMLRIAGGTPVALAVIPARVDAGLAAVLREAPAVAVLQHGWRHANRAAAGRKSEYPSGLPAALVAAEVAAGRDRLIALFGQRALPVFVPPWNRIAPEQLPVLGNSGIAAVSTIAPATTSEPPTDLPAGLALIDTHVDLTNWRAGRRFVGTAAALGSLVAWLGHVRVRDAAPAGPIGILTHHMIMDRETVAFLKTLTRLIAGHRAARWVDIAEASR
jgi:hypothetical protein